MALIFKPISWNTQKKWIDLILWGGIGLYIICFVLVSICIHPESDLMIQLIRASATAAFILLHFVLCIGPLCRLDRRFLPLLYNRRHMGVSVFILALIHVGLVLLYYHGFGVINPLVNVFVGNTQFDSISNFPFQWLGFTAFIILLIMALTSHDFWLTQLTAPIWKRIHMLVYIAYGLTLLHVVLGILQAETHLLYDGLTILGFLIVSVLHIVTGFKQRQADRELIGDGYIKALPVHEFNDGDIKPVTIAGDTIAVVFHNGEFRALSGICQHQNGPLSEGQVIKGCLVCPWHGYEYNLDTGCSPPPFNESVPVFDLTISGGWIYIHSTPQKANAS